MKQTFRTLDEFKSTVIRFEDRLDELDVNHKNFLLVSSVQGEAITSLNDVVAIVGMPLGANKGSSAILYYFTELDIPIEIKNEIEAVFNELFYNG